MLEAIARTSMSDYEHRIFTVIIRQTYGYKYAKTDWRYDFISLSQFIIKAGIAHKQNVIRTIKKLLSRNMIIRNGKKLAIQKDYVEWKSSKEITGNDNQGRLKKLPKEIKEVTQEDDKINLDGGPQNNKILQNNIPYKKIIDYLNLKADKKFNINEYTKELIEERYCDGLSLDDFKKVIDNKVLDWKKDALMNRFLEFLARCNIS